MHWSRKLILVGGTALVLAGGGTAVAIATGGTTATSRPPAPAPIAPRLLRSRSPMAVARTPSSATPRTAPPGRLRSPSRDGKTVDVRLDAGYKLVVVESDSETG